jgi:hypothetical protein
VSAPRGSVDACYVRAPAPDATDTATSPSYVGLRRRNEKLFDLDISVSTPGGATCSVAGVAKLRGEPGAEQLAMVIRPDPNRRSGRSGTLCQVFVQLTPAALEVRTTRTSCQAQALCEGRVELDGQRFEHATKLPAGARGPCFEKPSP